MKNVQFADRALAALELSDDPAFSDALIRAYRLRLQTIRAANDERDFYNMKSLRFEKLKGNRSHLHSMRLNDQFRLIVELVGHGPDKVIRIVSIEDYH